MREIYFVIIFLLARALLSPKFDEFTYFFLLNVIGISKLMFAILALIGNICGIIGALLYKSFFRNICVRWMIFWSMVVKTLEFFTYWCFAKRWTRDGGWDDLSFLITMRIIFEILSTIFMKLPLLALFAKITPPKIEGTIFATMTGTMNFGNTIISAGMGTWINHQFVGVNKRDLSRYPDLILI